MALRNYVPVDVENLPETFEYDLDGRTYLLTFKYNDEGDFFTVSFSLLDETLLVRDEKLVLDTPLFKGNPNPRLPATSLIPMDESGQATKCGIDEFMVSVFLFEDDLDPEDAAMPGPIDIDDDEEVD
ncbi:phage baseplate plug family protein [Levilactobacillus namurensis]|uniref:phage baseplate plug family protein n=1 Tax=Levilactobacillus namurensis TaxID=380393 RepID=UPI0026EC67EE|nr:hypothetical protein [Levilactobacillus namurensis]